MIDNISAVILAGGASSRLGGWTKARIRVGGKMIISRMLEVIKPVFEEIILVTNTAEEFREFGDLKMTYDEYKGAGPLGGIHAAIKVSEKTACFVFAGDMPLIDRDLILRETEFYLMHEKEIVVPLTGKFIEPLHSIYRNTIIHDLEAYLSDRNIKAVREFIRNRNIAYFIPGESDIKAFINVNLPADIIRVEKILAGMKR
jgi:molybdopterin-guanine dinucleotide biosynthesis protein A